MPLMKWTRDGKPIDDGTEQTPDFAKIKLKAIQRKDEGEYQMELTNDTGKETVPITIKVIGRSTQGHR